MSIFGPPKMALCPRCEAPLISTMAFRRYEFCCLECGHLCGFLDPHGAEPTPELEARYQALQAEWDEHVGGRLLVDGRQGHATDEQRDADRAAREWLKERTA